MLSIGPRLWKTGLAVAVTIALIRLTGHHYEVYGAVAAALAVAPSASRSLRTMGHQMAANLVGGLIGSLVMLLFGPNPVATGAAVILVLWLCQRLGYRELAPTVVAVTLFAMAPHSDSVTAYTFWRLLSVMIGSVVGTAINALIMPPDYLAMTMRAMEKAGSVLDVFILNVSGRLEEPNQIEKAEILAGAANVESQIAEARRLSLLFAESHRPEQVVQKEVAERALKVLSSLLERIQVVHKAALYAERADSYRRLLPEIQEALEQIVVHRKQLFGMLLAPDSDRILAPALLELERQFESSVEMPTRQEELEPFFRLYRMRSSVSYMANRLGRLYVAKEAALRPMIPSGRTVSGEESGLVVAK